MRNDPTGRALQLLSLLQTHRFWSCAELATRLDVTERTVRRDVDRLRELGYTVDSTSGRYGGYRLATGAHVPPLVLDDDEAVAVTVGLRYAAEAAIDGFEETSLRALTKIETLLPHRLRRRVSALHSSMSSVSLGHSADFVDPDALSVLAAACRDHEYVRFAYQRGDGEGSTRFVEPHRLVSAGRRWYLAAWDADRSDWRSFRLDRLRKPRLVGRHFAPRQIPGGDAGTFIARSIGSTPQLQQATLIVHSPFATLESVLRWIEHTPLEVTDDQCLMQIRSEDLGRLSLTVARIALTSRVEVIEPVELADTVTQLARNLDGSTPRRSGGGVSPSPPRPQRTGT